MWWKGNGAENKRRRVEGGEGVLDTVEIDVLCSAGAPLRAWAGRVLQLRPCQSPRTESHRHRRELQLRVCYLQRPDPDEQGGEEGFRRCISTRIGQRC